MKEVPAEEIEILDRIEKELSAVLVKFADERIHARLIYQSISSVVAKTIIAGSTDRKVQDQIFNAMGKSTESYLDILHSMQDNGVITQE